MFCLGFILNACVKESYDIAETETEIVFNLKMTNASSRANPTTYNASNINDVTILVFEGNGSNNYLYRRSGITPVNNQFTATILQSNDPIRMHIFANPNSSVNSTNHNGKTETEVINSLLTDLDLNSGSTDAFPMHGSVDIANVTEDMTLNSVVYLLRAMARVDINANPIIEDIFKLEGVSVYFTPNTGRWVSNYRIDENGNPATPIVTAPTLPSSITTIKTTSPVPTQVIDNKIESQLYIYENSANSTPRPSRIVVSGIYNNTGNTVYYPVDFTTTEGTAFDILRNHHYTINVNAITGSGYDNEDDAANGASIDISTDIEVWNSMEIGGGIDPVIELNAQAKVVLNHTSNNGSYTRTVPYTSTADVQLHIGGVEVAFPGNNTPINLDIPAAQSNWLTTATWIPTNSLEGILEFTHSTSNYNIDENYIVTITNGAITRNMEVCVADIGAIVINTGTTGTPVWLKIADRNADVNGPYGATVGNSSTDYGSYYFWSNAENNPTDADKAYSACFNFGEGNGAWRMPTRAELAILCGNNGNYTSDNNQRKLQLTNGTWKMYDDRPGQETDFVYFPMSGYLFNGGYGHIEQHGHYWSSTTINDGADILNFTEANGYTHISNFSIALNYQYPMRCVQDM